MGSRPDYKDFDPRVNTNICGKLPFLRDFYGNYANSARAGPNKPGTAYFGRG